MFKINENYLKLPGSYLFSTIGKKVAAYAEAHPDKRLIRLGIGDVTQPLAPGDYPGSARGGGRDGLPGNLPGLRAGSRL